MQNTGKKERYFGEESCFSPLHVFLPGGRDEPVDYASGVPVPAEGGHPPVNFHAWAAATSGKFETRAGASFGRGSVVALLIGRHLGRSLKEMRRLQAEGTKVLVCWKECGTHQIEGQMRRWRAGHRLAQLLREADGVLAASPAAEEFFHGRVPQDRLFVMPTPYPVDVPGWEHAAGPEKRQGIWVGTREPNQPLRHHDQAVALALRSAAAVGCEVTVMNVDGGRGRRHYEKIARAPASSQASLRIIDGPLPYADYLKAMSTHRLVLQLDATKVPGQVAGDALLTGTPIVGGLGMIERLTCPDWNESWSDASVVSGPADRLLRDDTCWTSARDETRKRAMELASFAAFRRRWTETYPPCLKAKEDTW